MTEEFYGVNSPCGYGIVSGLGGSVDSFGRFLDTYFSDLNNPNGQGPEPQCAVSAGQLYRLDTYYNRVIYDMGWFWDPVGIWKLWNFQ